MRAALRSVLLTATPLALAIGVFGMIYGAAAPLHMDALLAVAMSLLIFSGSLQFATIGLLASGAGAAAIVITAVALNTRHLVLGAILRPRLGVTPARRAALSWFLVDESFGLAITARGQAALVLLVSGVLFYIAWQVGTILGLLGARLIALEAPAAAIFPVLFIGLAAATVRGRSDAIRAVAAGVGVAALTVIVPAAHSFLPIVVAVLVALPGRGET